MVRDRQLAKRCPVYLPVRKHDTAIRDHRHRGNGMTSVYILIRCFNHILTQTYIPHAHTQRTTHMHHPRIAHTTCAHTYTPTHRHINTHIIYKPHIPLYTTHNVFTLYNSYKRPYMNTHNVVITIWIMG